MYIKIVLRLTGSFNNTSGLGKRGRLPICALQYKYQEIQFDYLATYNWITQSQDARGMPGDFRELLANKPPPQVLARS